MITQLLAGAAGSVPAHTDLYAPAAGPTPPRCRAGRGERTKQPNLTQRLCGRRWATRGGRFYFQRCLSLSPKPLCSLECWDGAKNSFSFGRSGRNKTRGGFPACRWIRMGRKNAASTVPAAPPSSEGRQEQNASVQSSLGFRRGEDLLVKLRQESRDVCRFHVAFGEH